MVSPLDPIADREFDVVVLGGGLTGSAIARQVAARGARTLLVEPVDFGWGGSGRTSRLALAALPESIRRSPRLLRVALAERTLLARTARHLVRVVPLFELGIARRGWRARLAGRLVRTPGWPAPRELSAAHLSALLPGLEAAIEAPARAVFDAVLDDRRIALLTALDAARAGALLAPRCDVTSLEAAGAGLAWLEVRDRVGGASVSVSARAVVNATGAWIDRTRRLFDAGGARSLFAVRRATGVVLPLPLEAALTLRHPRDAGCVTIAPAFGGALVAGPSAAEVPGGGVDDTVYLVEALQTLVADRGAPRRAFSRPFTDTDRPGMVRETVRGVPFWSVTAGPALFHRLAARRAAERLEAQLGSFPGPRPGPRGHLAGGDIASLAGEAAAVRAAGLSPRQARWLVERYGSRWRDVIDLGDEPIGNDDVPVRGEVAFAVAQEGARTLSDLLLRWRAPEIAAPGDEGFLAEAALFELARLEAWPGPRQQRERARWDRERALAHGPPEEPAARLEE